jgi:hypothetical protein
MMGGPLVAGIIADTTGSYVIGFQVLAALAALGSVFFVLATPPRPPGRDATVAVVTGPSATDRTP